MDNNNIFLLILNAIASVCVLVIFGVIVWTIWGGNQDLAIRVISTSVVTLVLTGILYSAATHKSKNNQS